MPKNVGLTQNTAAWLEWRRRHIGASDAPALLFLDRFENRDRWKLWLEKTGRAGAGFKQESDYETPAQRGQRLEAPARERYCVEKGVFAPPVCLECTRDGLEFMAASLDGLVAGSHIVELKNPKDARDHLAAREGEVPEQYFCQVQHQMHVAELYQCDYVSVFEDDLVIVPVKYDEPYVKELVSIEREFWHCVEDDVFPTPDPNVTVDLSDHADTLEVLQIYLTYRRQREAAEAKEQEVLARLKTRLVDVGIATGLGTTLHWEWRKGYLDLRAIPEVQEILRSGINLDQYRRPDSLIFQVERGK